MVSGRPSGSFVHASEKGIEYELEFEDEYDSGTIARLEREFYARFATCWYQSIGRVLMIALYSSGESCPSPILKSFSFRNRTRPRPRTRLPWLSVVPFLTSGSSVRGLFFASNPWANKKVKRIIIQSFLFKY